MDPARALPTLAAPPLRYFERLKRRRPFFKVIIGGNEKRCDRGYCILEIRLLEKTFPYYTHPPAVRSQRLDHPPVTNDILLKLCPPKANIRGRYGRIFASPVAMPETAVNKQDRMMAGKHQIRFAREPCIMQAVSETTRVQRLSQFHFRLGVAGANGRHHSRTNVPWNYVGHLLEGPWLSGECLV